MTRARALTLAASAVLLTGCSGEFLGASIQGPLVSVMPRWESIGGPPGAGRVNQLVRGTSPTELYAVLAEPAPRVFKTTDGGVTWQQLRALDGKHVHQVVPLRDRLYVCGGTVSIFQNGTVTDVGLPESPPCEHLFLIGTRLYVTAIVGSVGAERLLLTADTTQRPLTWTDISPTAAELSALVLPDASIGYDIRMRHVVRTGSTLLASVNLEAGLSGEASNGGVYASTDEGQTWTRTTLPVPLGRYVSALSTDSQSAPPRVLAGLRIPIQEQGAPLSEMLWQTTSGGTSWQPVAPTIAGDTNAITDFDSIEGVTYVSTLFRSVILRLSASEVEFLSGPRMPGFGELNPDAESLVFGDTQSTVYAVTNGNWEYGLLKSTDGLRTWQDMDAGITATSPTIVLAHPTSPQTIYTAGNIIQEKYFTTNGGQAWQPLLQQIMAVDELRVDPHNPSHLLAMSEITELRSSTNGGVGFAQIATDFQGARTLDAQIDAAGELYVSTLGLGISHSDNSTGNSWQYLRGSPDYVYAFRAHPQRPGELLVAASPRIFETFARILRYTPGDGATGAWAELFRAEDARGITALEFSPESPSTIYAGLVGRESTVLVSRNGGSTWAPLSTALRFSTIHALAVDPRDETRVFAAPWGGGLARRKGDAWVDVPIPTPSVAALAIDPSSGRVYAADRLSPTIYTSTDDGATWKKLVTLERQRYSRIAAMTLRGKELHFSVFRKRSGPLALLTDPMAGDAYVLRAGAPERLTGSVTRAVLGYAEAKGELYAVTHISGVHVLRGSAWEVVPGITMLPDIGFNGITADAAGRLYLPAGCDVDLNGQHRVGNNPAILHAVYVSDDAGRTWRKLSVGDPFRSSVKQLVVSPDDQNVLVAGTGTGVYVSRNRGVNWQRTSERLAFSAVGTLAVGRSRAYAGTLGGGVYETDVREMVPTIWKDTDGPTVTVQNLQLALHPTQPGTLYVSSYPGGVFKTEDGGATWSERNFGLPTFTVVDPIAQGYYSIAVARTSPETLYLGLFGKGVYKSTDGAATWLPLYGSMGVNAALMQRPITRVAVDPNDASVVYAATMEGVFVTRDAGATWADMSSGLASTDVRSLSVTTPPIVTFAEDFSDGSASWPLEGPWEIVAGELRTSSEAWTSFSPECGESTFDVDVRLDTGAQSAAEVKTAVVPGRGTILLIITPTHLRLAQAQNDVLTTLAEKDYPFGTGQQRRVRITMRRGPTVSVRVDGGEQLTATVVGGPVPGGVGYLLRGIFGLEGRGSVAFDDIAIQCTEDPQLVAGTAGYGAHTWSGAEWHQLPRPFGIGYWDVWDRRMYQFGSIQFDPDVAGRVYLGHFPGGFFTSEDGGARWKDSSVGLGNDGIFSLSMNPANHAELWAGTYNGLVVSRDRGQTWAASSAGFPPEQWPYTVAFDPVNRQVLYATTKNGKNKGFCDRNQHTFCGLVLKSTDGGAHWSQAMTGLPMNEEYYSLVVHPQSPQTLFVSSSKGAWISRDAASHWQTYASGLPALEGSGSTRVRDNVAETLALTPDGASLLLALPHYGIWRTSLGAR